MKTKDAVDYFGGHTALAEALGVTRQAIYMWGDDVPELRAYHIEAVMRERENSKRKAI